jgi:anti-sigma28 factor (negative regulator of flagellin synthesis)
VGKEDTAAAAKWAKDRSDAELWQLLIVFTIKDAIQQAVVKELKSRVENGTTVVDGERVE